MLRQPGNRGDKNGRLATENALLDDNGDGKAVRADWFRGIRPVKQSDGSGDVDGYLAHQFHLVRNDRERSMPPGLRRQRDELELAVMRLRGRKLELDETAYYQELETLLVQIAELHEKNTRIDR